MGITTPILPKTTVASQICSRICCLILQQGGADEDGTGRYRFMLALRKWNLEFKCTGSETSLQAQHVSLLGKGCGLALDAGQLAGGRTGET